MIPHEKTTSRDSRDPAGTSAAKKESRKRWPGGYVRDDVFVIEKKIHGRKFHVSTRCTSLRAALKQLERFESDPSSYRPEGTALEAGLVLDKEMIEAFFVWHETKASRHWALNVRSLLFDWSAALGGKDLRRLNLLEDVKPHLRGATQAHHRVKAIRGLFKWLRTERGDITRAQDVTLDLPVPVIPPALHTKSKAVPWASVVAVVPHLPIHVRDVLELLSATGWHVEEIRRFADVGTLRERNPTDPESVLAVMGAKHKSGRPHFTALLHQQHVAAARRIKERGVVIDNSRLRKHMLRAVAKANALAVEKAKELGTEPALIEPFQLGSMRHSVSTWLAQQGIPHEQTSRYLGHASPRTLQRHYVDAQAAAVVLPVQVLRVVS
jgi:integrase